jgi:protein O-mannosyl-transferase
MNESTVRPSTPIRAVNPAQWLLLIMILAWTCLVFYPGLDGGFIFDDEPNILNNPATQIETLGFQEIAAASGAYESGPVGRPLSTISLGLDWYFWDGSPRGFKVTNLLLHLINTLLLVFLARNLLRLTHFGRDALPWPAWAAFALVAIWAIHPLQVSTVLYAVQRMEILATTFIVLALLAYLRGRQLQIDGYGNGWLWLIGAGCLTIAGFFSKETGALAPVFALCLELTLLGFRTRNVRDAKALKAIYGIGIAGATLTFLVLVIPQYAAEGRFAHRDFTLQERLLTQLRVLPMYLGLMAWPTPDRLIFYYDALPASKGWLSPATTLLGGLLLAGLLGLAAILRRVAPLASLGILWFFTAHLLTSNVISLELAFEHRNYFALFAVLLTFAALFRHMTASRLSLPAPAMLIVLVLGLGLIGAIRAATWGDPLNLAMNHVAVNPESERARLDLGEIYLDMADGLPSSAFFQFAQNQFERAAELERSSPIAAQALILMEVQSGIDPDPRWQRSFLEKLASRPVNGPYMASVDNLIRQRFTGADISDELLVAAHEILLDRDGISPLLHARFGFLALETMSDDKLALMAFQRSVDLMGDDQDNIGGLLDSLRQRGHEQLASQLAAHRD